MIIRQFFHNDHTLLAPHWTPRFVQRSDAVCQHPLNFRTKRHKVHLDGGVGEIVPLMGQDQELGGIALETGSAGDYSEANGQC